MERQSDAVRFVYNLALEQRRDFWRQARAAGVVLNFISQGRELTALRAEVDWLAASHGTPLTYALRQLDDAFRSFFAKRAKYPTFRCKSQQPRFCFKGSEVRFVELSAKWALIRIPKIGLVKMRVSRPWLGRLVAVTFNRDAVGWHVALACEIEHEAPANNFPSIGIDRGIANTLSLSNGEFHQAPDLTHLERRKRRAQRILARRQRGSNRYRNQRRRVAAIAGKIARSRAHWRHEVTTNIASRFGLVAAEALNVANMTAGGRGKRGLNRSILEQGWGDVERCLAYKLEERGGTLVKVNPAYTSQTCSACGTIDKASRESQASFACRHCGFAAHADTNAAINILSRSTACVEGAGYGPVEARTDHDSLAA
jgi:putative transposase